MTKATAKKGIQVLERGRRLLVEHGWRQGDYGNRQEGFCSLGAIGTASLPSYEISGYGTAYHALQAVTGESALSRWNDAAGRTKRQVLGAFRRAQTYLRRQA